MLRRERWWEPHAQHLYQAMARRWGHPAVTLGYAGWTLAATAIAAMPTRPAFTVASVLMWYTTAALLWLVLQRRLATGCDTH